MLTNAPHTHTQNQKQTNPSIVYHCRRFTYTAKQKKMTFAIKKERKKNEKEKLNIIEKNTPTQNKLSQTNKQEKLRTNTFERQKRENKTSEKSFISLSYPVVDK
uniref:(northern house mosquito) hypothetical protein n=1 Tax=Culex pipiens TaxID=7175 RepID=A0A8D8BU81_CULPI